MTMVTLEASEGLRRAFSAEWLDGPALASGPK